MSQRQHYKWPISEALTNRLGSSSYGAQRAMLEEDQLLLVLHSPPLEDRKREHEVFLRLPDGSSKGQWLHNGQKGGEFAMSCVLDAYEKHAEIFAEQLEEAITSAALIEIIGHCIPLSRASSNLHKALQQARELVPEDAWLIDQRDRSVEIARAFELLLADARLDLEYHQAYSAEHQARATEEVTRAQRKLNTIAAMTFPVMALGAALGMNLHNSLEDKGAWLFWTVVFAGVVLGWLVRCWVNNDRN